MNMIWCYILERGGGVILITELWSSGGLTAVHTDFFAISSRHTVLDTQAVTKTSLSVGATHIREQHQGKLKCKFWLSYLKEIDPMQAEEKGYCFCCCILSFDLPNRL